MIKKASDLEVFQLSYKLAMDIFLMIRSFSKEEKYSLTDQITRSSRSITVNIAEGWGRRVYENEFKKHLVYAMGSLEETKVWLKFTKDCTYINTEAYDILIQKSEEVGVKIFKLYDNWKSF
ncbi:MAG: four helix bundle protein [Bacteroidetes bacterium]|nr:four helix bundle protein [Bacteroidota bacterium]MBS1633167.1 four helix bundle protein [Bacteroidota bacterium]